MAWLSKIQKAKLAGGALIIAGLAGLVYWAYKVLQQKPPPDSQHKQQQQEILQQIQQQHKQPTLQQTLQQLKHQINIENPSIQQIKTVLSVLAHNIKDKTVALSNTFKQQRRNRFPHQQRLQNMSEYLKYSSEGLMKLQQVIIELQNQQTQLLNNLGIQQTKFEQYSSELNQFMQDIIHDSTITLEQVKKSLNIKTEYLQANGQKIINSLIDLSSGLTLQQKQFIPSFLNTIISDQAFQNEPALDKEEFEMAYEKYRVQANPELVRLQKVLIPLIGKLQTALIEDQMGGLGGFGGVQSYPSQGDEDTLAKQQMMKQQLQFMRQSDPQGYNQMMAMVQAQNN